MPRHALNVGWIRRRTGILAAVMLALVMAVATPSLATAAVSGRLDGAFTVDESVTSVTNVVGERVGDSFKVVWQFRASCAAGPCTTTLTRQLVKSGETLTYAMAPAADGTYRATGGTRAVDCVNSDGSLRLANGYTNTDTISIEPTAVDGAGNVTAWSGSTSVTGVATPEAVNAGCAPTQEIITLLGTVNGKPSLPALDAGTFAKFRYGPPPVLGQNCTTGFGVSKGGVSYETGAKHCITNEEDTHANSTIAIHQPMTINTGDDKYTFAAGINCSPPAPSACLLPTVVKGQTGDVMAWKPDTATVTGRVQTANGVLPVVGAKAWQNVQNQTICHYGYGSTRTGPAERCGTAFSQASARLYEYHGAAGGTVPFDSGLVPEPMFGDTGDSGGPVYVYNATKTGVYAIGLEIGAGRDCLHVGRRTFACLNMSFILPIGTVLDRLGGAAIITSRA